MAKSQEWKLTRQSRHRPIEPEPMREAVRSFLRNSQASSKRVACLECGSTSDLLRIVACLYGSAETWEILLPLCERCASKDSASVARSEHRFSEGAARVISGEVLQ